MRKVLESDAIHRDDSDPFVPSDASRTRGRSTFNWPNVSHAMMPSALRDWAISVAVRTNKRRYDPGEPVHFRVSMTNRIPFPVALRTRSPVLWSWAIGDIEQATQLEEPRPTEPSLLRFARSERKTFERRWTQRIQDIDGRWTPVDSGEYELSAWINVDGADDRGLNDNTTITVG